MCTTILRLEHHGSDSTSFAIVYIWQEPGATRVHLQGNVGGRAVGDVDGFILASTRSLHMPLHDARLSLPVLQWFAQEYAKKTLCPTLSILRLTSVLHSHLKHSIYVDQSCAGYWEAHIDRRL